MALYNVSTRKFAHIFAPIDKPKTAESKQSKIAEAYNLSSLALISVISVTHFLRGVTELISNIAIAIY